MFDRATKIENINSEGSARDALSMLDQAASCLHREEDTDIITVEFNE